MVIPAADGRMSTSGSAAPRLVNGPVKIVSGVMEGRMLGFSATMGHDSHGAVWKEPRTATNSHEQPLPRGEQPP